VKLEAFGDAAWRADLPGDGDRRALLEALRAVPGVLDAVVSERHAVVTFEPGAPPREVDVRGALEQAPVLVGSADRAREHVVRVRYDGLDLDEIARALGSSTAEVIARHSAPRYVVVAVGFQPGFAYLRAEGGSPLVLPRRPTPRTRVPALSVGIAGPYTGIYPFASPGGWNLVGTAVGFEAFTPRAGGAMGGGDGVRFEEAGSGA
jgi:UPF0271 protein